MTYTRKIINYMEQHYTEDIKAKDFARGCGLSETHMRRIFSEYTNMPPSEYLNVVRINKACEQLAHGLSPSTWRKKALENPQNIATYQISVLKGW